MNFFEQQQRARRQTLALFAYFLLAVALIIAAVNAVLYFTLYLSDTHRVVSPGLWLNSPLSWGTALGTLAIIIGGSLTRHYQLRSGGDELAVMVGGRLISPDTRAPLEKRLINVAEEMAIAAGTHTPRVYVLDEEAGINGFVAGYRPSNTALVISRGAIETLDRDELQGVIAHEYSHILNGDTRININLISILAGILLIGRIGEALIRSGSRARRNLSRRNSASIGQMVLGFALMCIGYVGLFFGRLIKAAIARQREFLADGASVQFTRNPYGIGGALFKTVHHPTGSTLRSSYAEDVSHMCFSEPLKVRLSSLLSSHPTVEERLLRIDPSLLTRMKSRLKKGKLTLADGTSPFCSEAEAGAASGRLDELTSQFSPSSNPATEEPSRQVEAGLNRAETAQTEGLSAQELKNAIGTLPQDSIRKAHQVHQQIPDPLLTIAHDPAKASCILFGLILTTLPPPRNAVVRQIYKWTSKPLALKSADAYRALLIEPEQIRLPLLDIAIASCESLKENERVRLIQMLREVAGNQKRFSLESFIYLSLAAKYLLPSTTRHISEIHSYKKAENAIAVLVAHLVRASHADKATQRSILARIMRSFSDKNYGILVDNPPDMDKLELAVCLLERLSPLLKQPLIEACVDCILSDQKVTSEESGLLRAVCARLDCPLPLLE